MNKYHNKKTVIDGHTFDSKKESQRYLYLKSQLKEGCIRNLMLQPKYILQDEFESNGKKIKAIAYIADFCYDNLIDGKHVIEDTKGFKTRDYIIKKKLLMKMLKTNEMFLET